MLLSEEQQKSFTDQLQHTTARGGEYLIMPNAAQPAFLIPMESKEVYVKALALVKPISGKGELKKRLLSYVPPKWLKIKMKSLKVHQSKNDGRYSIILPWSQKITEKVTYISFDLGMRDIRVHKYAFSDETRKMVRNEHKFLLKMKGISEKKIITPDVLDFKDSSSYTCITQEFIDGMHMKQITASVETFFSQLSHGDILPLNEHPYIKNRLPEVRSYLTDAGQTKLLGHLDSHLKKYEKDQFKVATMHSDFSSTNTVKTANDKCVIIDWEDACEDGICIDAEYFNFRQTLYEGKSWLIKNAEQFLAAFHYVYFMVKKDNPQMLNRFKLTEESFSLV